MNQRTHARRDRLAVARGRFELPTLDRGDRRMIVISAYTIVDVGIEHCAVGGDGDDDNDVHIAIGRRVCRPVRRGLRAHVRRNDRVRGVRAARDRQ